uniref:TSA: Wollemia nobilis Ref_Wollemi_Transcript_9708_911 transcribed RNA sequence n=1 Tax=Wollemia nobilis TaxID=56998 RepID=A0A0C9S745_9CONI
MELGRHEGGGAGETETETPMAISASFNVQDPVAVGRNSEDNQQQKQHKVSNKLSVRYRECQKNHAAAMGGNATDGCGEFMPSGEEGTLEALKCCACGCHRNFHRRVVEGENLSVPSCDCFHMRRDHFLKRSGVLFPPPPPPDGVADPFAFSNILPRPPLMSFQGAGPSESEDHETPGFHSRPAMLKKRFRTKFTQEQKERMLEFAEKVGWKLQKHDDLLVQQFCQEIGVRRRVLKVWMHNNKHTLAG